MGRWPVTAPGPCQTSTGPVIRDRGSGVVWVLAALGVVWTLGLAALLAAQAVTARHRAGTAADLAALAGASAAVTGWDAAACALADAVARANGAQLVRCRVQPGARPDYPVELTVLVHLPWVGQQWGLPPAPGSARAGAGGALPLPARSGTDPVPGRLP